MATVRKYRDRWVADYRDQHGKRRIETPHGKFENLAQERRAAQELLTKRQAEVARGDDVAARARLTFGEVCDRYLTSKVNIRDSTMRSYAGLIACYLHPYFGSWKIHTITASDIERYRGELARGLPPAIADAIKERRSAAKPKWSQARVRQSISRRKPGTRTINKSLTLLTMIFKYAARHRWVDYNPAGYVEKLKDDAALHHRPIDENILAPEEIEKLIAAADDHYRVLIQTAVFTGMRQGELLGLQWGDIDWNERQIHVRRAFKDGVFTQPKTRNSQRRVDLPELLVRELKAWRLRCPKGELGMLFPNGVGNPETHANVLQRGFYPAPRRAGLRKIRFHDLRHTFASLLLANGEDVVRVSRLLGHASPHITLNTYSHMLPKEHYGSTDRLAQLVYGAAAPTGSPTESSQSTADRREPRRLKRIAS